MLCLERLSLVGVGCNNLFTFYEVPDEFARTTCRNTNSQ
jgi:hypothetical protein